MQSTTRYKEGDSLSKDKIQWHVDGFIVIMCGALVIMFLVLMVTFAWLAGYIPGTAGNNDRVYCEARNMTYIAEGTCAMYKTSASGNKVGKLVPIPVVS